LRWIYFNPGAEFTCEQVREELRPRLEPPPEPRSWGGVLARAQDARFITAVSQARSKKRGAWVTVWRAR
jgi:hypothetical protein